MTIVYVFTIITGFIGALIAYDDLRDAKGAAGEEDIS